ncbi:hypothetical protein D3C85_886390 [compost metagenome]
MARHEHAAPVQVRRRLGHRAPQHAAREPGLVAVGMQLAAQRGMNAVGAHQDVGAHGLQRAVRAAAEPRRHARGVLLGRLQDHAGDDGVRSQALAHGLREQHLEFATMHRILRQRIARLQAPRLAPDGLPELVVVVKLRGLDGAFVERGHQTQLLEFAHGVRQQVDPHPQRPQFLRAFIYAATDAAPMQHQRKRQPAYAGAGDDDLHVHSQYYLLCNITKLLPDPHRGFPVIRWRGGSACISVEPP